MVSLNEYKKIVVTGGAGFIGSNFVRYLLNNHNPQKIVIIDKLTYASSFATIEPLLSEKKIEFYRLDISNMSLLQEVITSDVDLVVHFAAESFNDTSLKNPRVFLESNVIGTFNVLELCREFDIRLHHISTDEVFGDFPLESKDKFKETTAYNPSSPYASTKASADLLVKAWVRSFGVCATISNCSNNYGAFQNPEKFIPRQITNLLRGLKPELYGTGLNIRDWIHVEDHCRAICLIIEQGSIGETYMIGVDNERTNLEVLQLILTHLGYPSDYFDFVEDRKGHDLRYGIDATKLISELGFKHKHTDFEKALKSTVDWYKTHEDWWLPLIEKKEKLN